MEACCPRTARGTAPGSGCLPVKGIGATRTVEKFPHGALGVWGSSDFGAALRVAPAVCNLLMEEGRSCYEEKHPTCPRAGLFGRAARRVRQGRHVRACHAHHAVAREPGSRDVARDRRGAIFCSRRRCIEFEHALDNDRLLGGKSVHGNSPVGDNGGINGHVWFQRHGRGCEHDLRHGSDVCRSGGLHQFRRNHRRDRLQRYGGNCGFQRYVRFCRRGGNYRSRGWWWRCQGRGRRCGQGDL